MQPRSSSALLATVAIWLYYRVRESTDDARVEGHVHPIAARVAGPVVAIHIKENDAVEAGDLLFEIDQADYRVALAAAEAGSRRRQSASLGGEDGCTHHQDRRQQHPGCSPSRARQQHRWRPARGAANSRGRQ